jgi:protein-disulfide isomerase
MADWGGWKSGLVAGLCGIVIGALAVGGYYGFRTSGRDATEAVVRDYILAHGEILPEAMDRLQQRRAAASVGRHRSVLERPYHGAWAGAADGDVVLVEFFDYACPYCRATNGDVERLLGEDARLKLVWRELPILGPDSRAAALVSMDAARQGRFRAFHDRMFALGRPTGTLLAEAAAQAGVRREGESAEARAELDRNFELAREIGLTGTPTFVVGGQVLQGAVGYEALKRAVAAARASR